MTARQASWDEINPWIAERNPPRRGQRKGKLALPGQSCRRSADLLQHAIKIRKAVEEFSYLSDRTLVQSDRERCGRGKERGETMTQVIVTQMNPRDTSCREQLRPNRAIRPPQRSTVLSSVVQQAAHVGDRRCAEAYVRVRTL